jgi:hypothetical protein
MKLPSEAIVEFQTLWKQMTGADLAFGEAEKQAKSFLQVLRGSLAPSDKNMSASTRDPP